MALNITIDASGATSGSKTAVTALRKIKTQARLAFDQLNKLETAFSRIVASSKTSGVSLANLTKKQKNNNEAIRESIKARQKEDAALKSNITFAKKLVKAGLREKEIKLAVSLEVKKHTKLLRAEVVAMSEQIRKQTIAESLAAKNIAHLRLQIAQMKRKYRMSLQVTAGVMTEARAMEMLTRIATKNIAIQEAARKRAGLNTMAYMQSEAAMRKRLTTEKNVRESLAKTDKRFNASTSALTKYTMLITSLSASYLVLSQVLQSLKRVLDIGIQFERNMAVVKAVSRATITEFRELKDAAREAGETTVWTASNAAEALKFLAMAGFNATESIRALPGVLRLALIGQMDLGQATDIVTDTLNAMQLKISQLKRVNDVFVATITRTNTDVKKMGEAMKYAAPVAGELGYEIEQVSAMIGVLSQSGIKAGIAGRGLQTSMVRTAKAARTLGIDIDSNLIEVIDRMIKRQTTLTQIQEIFGLRALKTVLVLKTQREAYDKLVEKLRNAAGESDEFAKIYGGTVGGALKRVRSIMEEQVISVFEDYSYTLKNTLYDLTSYIRDHSDEIKSFFRDIVDLGTAIGKDVIGVLGMLTQTISNLSSVIPEGYGKIATYGLIGRFFFGSWGPLKLLWALKLIEDLMVAFAPNTFGPAKEGEIKVFYGPMTAILKATELGKELRKLGDSINALIEIYVTETREKTGKNEYTKEWQWPFDIDWGFSKEAERLGQLEVIRENLGNVEPGGLSTLSGGTGRLGVTKEQLGSLDKEIEDLRHHVEKYGQWDVPRKLKGVLKKWKDADTGVISLIDTATEKVLNLTHDTRTAGVNAAEATINLEKRTLEGLVQTEIMRGLIPEGSEIFMDVYGKGAFKRQIVDYYRTEQVKIPTPEGEKQRYKTVMKENITEGLLSAGLMPPYSPENKPEYMHALLGEKYADIYKKGEYRQYIIPLEEKYPEIDWKVAQAGVENGEEFFQEKMAEEGKAYAEYFVDAMETIRKANEMFLTGDISNILAGEELLQELREVRDSWVASVSAKEQVEDLTLKKAEELLKGGFLDYDPSLQKEETMMLFRRNLELPAEAIRKALLLSKRMGKTDATNFMIEWEKAFAKFKETLYETNIDVMAEIKLFKEQMGDTLPKESFDENAKWLAEEYKRRFESAMKSAPGGMPDESALKALPIWEKDTLKDIKKIATLKAEIARRKANFEAEGFELLPITEEQLKSIGRNSSAVAQETAKEFKAAIKSLLDDLKAYTGIYGEIETTAKRALNTHQDTMKKNQVFKRLSGPKGVSDEYTEQVKIIEDRYTALMTSLGEKNDYLLKEEYAKWESLSMSTARKAESLYKSIKTKMGMFDQLAPTASAEVKKHILDTYARFQTELKNTEMDAEQFLVFMQTFKRTIDGMVNKAIKDEEPKLVIDILRANQVLIKEMESMYGRSYENERKLLEEQYKIYEKTVDDKILLERWYQFKKRQLQRDELLEYGKMKGGIAAYLMDIQDLYRQFYKRIGQITYESMHDIYQTVEDTFFFAFKNDMDSLDKAWTDLWEKLRDTFYRTWAEMAAKKVFADIIPQLTDLLGITKGKGSGVGSGGVLGGIGRIFGELITSEEGKEIYNKVFGSLDEKKFEPIINVECTCYCTCNCQCCCCDGMKNQGSQVTDMYRDYAEYYDAMIRADKIGDTKAGKKAAKVPQVVIVQGSGEPLSIYDDYSPSGLEGFVSLASGITSQQAEQDTDFAAYQQYYDIAKVGYQLYSASAGGATALAGTSAFEGLGAIYTGAAGGGGFGTAVAGGGALGSGVSWGAAGAYGAIGSLLYGTIGEAIGLPQSKYSGIGSGLGAAGGAMAATAWLPMLGAAAGPIGMIVGAVLGGIIGSFFGGDSENTYTMEGVNMLINKGSLTPADTGAWSETGNQWVPGKGMDIFDQAPAFGSYGMTTPQNAGTAAWFYPASDAFRQARNAAVEQLNEDVNTWLGNVPDSLRDSIESQLSELNLDYSLNQRIPVSGTGAAAEKFANEYYEWLLTQVNSVLESEETKALIEAETKKALYRKFIAPIIDLLNQITMTDFEYTLHNLTGAYDLKVEELLSLDLEEEMFNEGLSLLTQAFALQAANLNQANTLIDDFITEMALSDLAPVQSMEAFQNQYDTLVTGAREGGPEDIEKLLGYIGGDYLPFMQSFFGDDTGYQDLWDQIMGPEGTLRGIQDENIIEVEQYVTDIVETLTEALEALEINVDSEILAKNIADAFAGNLEGRGNEDRPLQLIIDGQVIAEVVINQAEINPELRYIIQKIVEPEQVGSG